MNQKQQVPKAKIPSKNEMRPTVKLEQKKEQQMGKKVRKSTPQQV